MNPVFTAAGIVITGAYTSLVATGGGYVNPVIFDSYPTYSQVARADYSPSSFSLPEIDPVAFATPTPLPTATPTVTKSAATKKSSSNNAPSVATSTSPTASSTQTVAYSNPLSGRTLFVNPNNPAALQANALRTSNPSQAALLDRIGSQSQAAWFGNWNQYIQADVSSYVKASGSALPVLVAYNIPNRDCGGYSAGGASASGYLTWIQGMANGIGSHPAVVILEPDSITLSSCLSGEALSQRYNLLQSAIGILKANASTSVYIDAGHSNWLSAEEVSSRLILAGIASADGFALNVSNFQTTASNIAYGNAISANVGGKHFVIDTSRNGNGPASDGSWCNPTGRALGTNPTTNTGNALVDAFLWIKTPGESDGTCNGGPSAGTWWNDYALGLVNNAL